MTFRGLAVFSLAAVFGSMQACRPPGGVVRPTPTPLPLLSMPAPTSPSPSLPSLNPITPVVPEPLSVPEIANDTWKPSTAPRDWTSIVIHHTATQRGSVESIHETHVAREWLGIGYHFVIGNGNGMPDGEIEPTFRWREQLHGAHAGSDEYNQHGIGIALIGNFEEQPPTDSQVAAIKRLVAFLKSEYRIDSEHVIGHGEVKATACPGKLFPLAEVSETNIANLSQPSMIRPASLKHSTQLPAANPSVRMAIGSRDLQRSASLADLSGSRLP